MYKSVYLYEKAHRYFKNDYQFFDALKTKDCKIRGNCNLLTKVKFHELERNSPVIWWMLKKGLFKKGGNEKIYPQMLNSKSVLMKVM